ncbi:MAG: endonuclease III [Deltaproteobacteria bacterium]|nr:endonuclease III [Deltaproteobacteria bacterium]
MPYKKEDRKNNSPFFVLLSAIISHRTKDEITEKVMQKIEGIVNGPEDLVQMSQSELQKLLFPAGFYRNKAKILKDVAETILNNYGGKVPDTLEELLKLRGIGRKTANLVISEGYGKPGICVDTHVHRISNRLGLVKTNHPEETEFELRNKMPVKYWNDYNWLMVNFGRTICRPISPLCSKCPLNTDCPKIGVKKRR